MNDRDREYLVDRFQLPRPRLALGQSLLGIATASLDVSDGLIADLGHIAETSSVRVCLDAAKLPVSPGLRALWGGGPEAIVREATAGDDYEIAFTAPIEKGALIEEAAASAKVAVTEIGRCEAGQGVMLLDENRREIPIARPGYVHF